MATPDDIDAIEVEVQAPVTALEIEVPQSISALEVEVASAVGHVEVEVAQPVALVEVETQAAIQTIEVQVPGIQGPIGPAGNAGEGFTHTQSSAEAEWIVNHNLGFRPTVSVFSAAGAEVIAEVLHVSLNQARIYFASSQTGSVRCV